MEFWLLFVVDECQKLHSLISVTILHMINISHTPSLLDPKPIGSPNNPFLKFTPFITFLDFQNMLFLFCFENKSISCTIVDILMQSMYLLVILLSMLLCVVLIST